MANKKTKSQVEFFIEEQNPKTLTFRCIEAILLRHNLLNKDDKQQLNNFRKNVVPDFGEMLIAIEGIYAKHSIDDLAEFYLRYGVDVPTYQ